MRTKKVGSHNVFVTLGASNHTEKDRQKNDYYATHPSAIPPLFEVENFDNMIWECACGEGHLSEAMEEYGKDVFSTDKIDRGYGQILDFLDTDMEWHGDIITNPLYKYAQDIGSYVIKNIIKADLSSNTSCGVKE